MYFASQLISGDPTAPGGIVQFDGGTLAPTVLAAGHGYTAMAINPNTNKIYATESASGTTVIHDFSGAVQTGHGLEETQNAIQGAIFVTDTRPSRHPTNPAATSRTTPTDYTALLPPNPSHRALAQQFIEFLFTDNSQRALTDSGFQPIACSGPIARCGPSFTG